MSDKTPLIDYIIKNPRVLINTDFLREIWMIPERTIASSKKMENGSSVFEVSCLSDLYIGKLFVFENMFYAVKTFQRIDNRNTEYKTFRVSGENIGVIYDDKEQLALCTPQDVFTLEPGDIPNYTDQISIKTTLGRFSANYLFFVYPFGETIPYLNEEFTASKMEKRIVIPLLENKISVSSVKDKYINTLSLIGQSTDIICPNISENTISIPPEITNLRKYLIDKHKDALAAGDTSVMSEIETTLINKYKEYLKGDSSLHFLLKKKYFDVTLKKLFLVQGMVETFGSPGEFTFVDNPMGNGWKVKDLPVIFNEVRQGSYARGIETQNGGQIAKLILRVLQDTRITMDDCGTNVGEPIKGNSEQLKDFEWNYVINSDGSNTLITQNNIDELAGKDLIIRTPGFCKSPQGFCAKCFGKLFEVIGQKAFAPVANDFGRTQMTNSLKKMHGVSYTTVDVSDVNKWLIIQ